AAHAARIAFPWWRRMVCIGARRRTENAPAGQTHEREHRTRLPAISVWACSASSSSKVDPVAWWRCAPSHFLGTRALESRDVRRNPVQPIDKTRISRTPVHLFAPVEIAERA